MNYFLKKIIDECCEALEFRSAGRSQIQHDAGIRRIRIWARELQKVLDGEPHAHLPGQLADLSRCDRVASSASSPTAYTVPSTAMTTSRAGNPAITADDTRQSQPSGANTGSMT